MARETGALMVQVHDRVVSADGALKVTLIAYDPRTAEGRTKVEELHRRVWDDDVHVRQ